MLGKLIVALLIIVAAAVVTLTKQESEVADLNAAIAESKFDDVDARAQLLERRASTAEGKLVEAEARLKILEQQVAQMKAGPVAGADTVVIGPLNVDAIEATLEKSRAQLGACWLLAGGYVEDTLTLRWVVEADGKAHLTRAEGERGGALEQVATCLQRRIDALTFPKSARRDSFTVVRWQFGYDADAFEPQAAPEL